MGSVQREQRGEIQWSEALPGLGSVKKRKKKRKSRLVKLQRQKEGFRRVNRLQESKG